MADQSPMPDSSQLMAALDAPKPPQDPSMANAYGLPTGAMDTIKNAATPAGQSGQQPDPNMLMSALQRQSSQNSAGMKALSGQEMAELNPLQQQLSQLQQSPKPQQPNLREQLMKSPQAQDYLKLAQDVKKSSQDYMGTAGILSGIVGLFARKHTTLALKAFTAAVDGFKKGQDDVVKQQLEIFKDANAQAVQNAKFLQDEYTNAMNDRKASAQEIISNMWAITEKYQVPMAAFKADENDSLKVAAFANNIGKAANTAQAQSDKLVKQVEDLQAAQGSLKQDGVILAARQQGGVMASAADQAQAILKGDAKLPPSSQRTPINQAIRALVFKANPDFDEAKFGAKQSGESALSRDVATGNIAQNTRFINTARGHINKDLIPAAEALNNSNFVPYNDLVNKSDDQIGDPRLIAYKVAAKTTSDEFAKAFAGAGGSAASDRDEYLGLFRNANSPAQVKAIAQKMNDLLDRRAEAIDAQTSGQGQAKMDAEEGTGGDSSKPNTPAEASDEGWGEVVVH